MRVGEAAVVGGGRPAGRDQAAVLGVALGHGIGDTPVRAALLHLSVIAAVDGKRRLCDAADSPHERGVGPCG